MLEIYDLTEWNSAVVDSVLVNGNQYFQDCVQDIKDEDYELSVDDLKVLLRFFQHYCINLFNTNQISGRFKYFPVHFQSVLQTCSRGYNVLGQEHTI